jgi:hypothetical protein
MEATASSRYVVTLLVRIPLMTVAKTICYGRLSIIRYASNGCPFVVWEGIVPRINPRILDSVIYLYNSVSDAKAGTSAGGSGFLTFVRVPDQPKLAWIYAVTNRHVKESAPVVRINRADGRVAIFPFQPTDWIGHPDKLTDLAVVCLNVKVATEYQFLAIFPENDFLTRQKIDLYKINVGDDTFLVGRLINRDGVLRNLPSVRAGIIAQMPNPSDPIETEAGKQEAYLVEARSISGYSGSPMFVWVPPSRYYQDFRKMQGPEWNVPVFLGIDCGHVPDYTPVLEWDEEEQRLKETGHQVEVNTGMAIVIPAYKLQELLDCDELVGQRAEALKKVPKQPVGKLDVAKKRKNRDVAVPPIS